MAGEEVAAAIVKPLEGGIAAEALTPGAVAPPVSGPLPGAAVGAAEGIPAAVPTGVPGAEVAVLAPEVIAGVAAAGGETLAGAGARAAESSLGAAEPTTAGRTGETTAAAGLAAVGGGASEFAMTCAAVLTGTCWFVGRRFAGTAAEKLAVALPALPTKVPPGETSSMALAFCKGAEPDGPPGDAVAELEPVPVPGAHAGPPWGLASPPAQWRRAPWTGAPPVVEAAPP